MKRGLCVIGAGMPWLHVWAARSGFGEGGRGGDYAKALRVKPSLSRRWCAPMVGGSSDWRLSLLLL